MELELHKASGTAMARINDKLALLIPLVSEWIEEFNSARVQAGLVDVVNVLLKKKELADVA